ncbi:choice-of-anchor P family protein [Saccharothrix coeruleofusca]|uniref:Secreted protein n=1 Tax=Saccharothrix coeruleofusca TaxID=33919 RepID=A0A918EEJ3_9PSEU|nr:choice-of-anchor P family protein [Saccharothrix coeruleofusca]MBP2337226.1 hypothetical protein [Saccharothrix coeruleofusca]GGP66325.1 hypothetical protein GCM10010185_43710 [Saccharothrix coeruleofusca]
MTDQPRSARRRGWRALSAPALCAVLALTAPGAASAERLPRAGNFVCQANILRLADQVWTQANPAASPCADDFEASDRQDVSFLGVYRFRSSVIDVRTDQLPDVLGSTPPAAGDMASSSARLASMRLTGPDLLVEFGAVHADAVATCVASGGALTPSYTARSTVATLRINGTEVVDLTGPRTIPLNVGKLLLNHTVTTASGITRRAAVWDTPLFDLIMGEARVSTSGNPCG